MGKGLRIAVLSSVPEVIVTLNSVLERLGQELTVSVVAARKRSVAGPTAGSAMAALSGAHSESVVAPDKESLESILKLSDPDIMLSWGFPWRIPKGALAVPKYGSINFHPSLLPRHRGPHPLAWTVRMGDENFGVTWHRMDPEFDSGPIMAQRSTPACADDTSQDVVPRLSWLGLRMLGDVIERIASGESGEPQPTEGATEEGTFGRDYTMIDWSMPARAVHDQVRAWGFIPRTHSVIGPIGTINGKSVRVVHTTLTRPHGQAPRVDCGDGPLWVTESEPVD